MNTQPTVIPNGEDYVNASALFGGIKRTIFSKDFKGGRISNWFGGTELDFTHADLNGMAVLDISQAFGATTITVPGDWRIEADFSQLLAVIDDNRNNVYQTNKSDKILMLKGVSVCANVEIISSL